MDGAFVCTKVVIATLVSDVSSADSERQLMADEACEEDSSVLWSFAEGKWCHSEGVVGLEGGVGEQATGEEELQGESRGSLAAVSLLDSLEPESLSLLPCHIFGLGRVE